MFYMMLCYNNCLENFRLGNVRSKKDSWTLFVIYYRRVNEVNSQGGSLYYNTTYSVLTCMNLHKEQN